MMSCSSSCFFQSLVSVCETAATPTEVLSCTSRITLARYVTGRKGLGPPYVCFMNNWQHCIGGQGNIMVISVKRLKTEMMIIGLLIYEVLNIIL